MPTPSHAPERKKTVAKVLARRSSTSSPVLGFQGKKIFKKVVYLDILLCLVIYNMSKKVRMAYDLGRRKYYPIITYTLSKAEKKCTTPPS